MATVDESVRVLYVGSPETSDTVAARLEAADERLTVTAIRESTAVADHLRAVDCLVVGDGESDPLTLLDRLRRHRPGVPVVLFTTDTDTIAAGIDAGVTDWVRQTGEPSQYRLLAASVVAAADASQSSRDLEHDRLRRLVTAAWDLTAVVDSTGKCREVVSADPAVVDGDPSELAGGRLATHIPANLAGRIVAATRRAGETSEPQRIVCGSDDRRFEGTVIHLSTTADGVVTAFVGVRVWVTPETGADRWNATQSQRLLSALSATLPTYTFVCDETGEYLEAIVGYQQSDMYEPDDIVGRTVAELFPPDVADRLLATIDDALAADSIQVVEYPIEKPDGTGWYEARVAPVSGGYEGQPAVVVSAVEITERRRRKRELERQNERLEEFASIVSHDLRNPLSVASGRLRLAREECDSDHLDDVARALDRMDELVADLLTLSRNGQQVGEMQSVALDAVVEDCWTSVSTSKATLTVETDRTVVADRSRLEQLLENLVRNGIEHGGQRGAGDGDLTDYTDVAITVGALDDEQGFYVADDGPGIPPGARDRVFDTDYSTSEEGTGLGLSIVAALADAHGWDVRIRESDAGGARFEFTGVEFAD